MSNLSNAEREAPVIVRLAKATDIPAIARCWYHAFFDDVVIGEIMHPFRKEYPDDVYYFLLRGIRERYFDWSHRFVVATVNDRVVGAAEWRRLGSDTNALQLWRFDPRNIISPAISLWNSLSLKLYPNRAADPTRSSYLDAAVEGSTHHWTGGRAECWDLHICGVHPEWQGKGVGKKVVAWGTARADEEGVCCSVITGETKRAFYARSGFVGDGKLGGQGIILFRNPIA
ncbi:acyl-CoA N-acyltransferase [Coniochaeta sp. 2T2.1]|nr:acyl-CoA N-acyltransferase [Coniochaeta sp. 2T2.1]